MKSLSVALKAHLDQTVTSVARIWEITRLDGNSFYVTDHDQDLSFGGQQYLSTSAISTSAFSADNALSVDTLEVSGADDAVFTMDDFLCGLFNGSSVLISLVNWQDLTMGSMILRKGTMGEVTTSDTGTFTFEVRSLSQALQQDVNRKYQSSCDADLGDARCSINIFPTAVLRDTIYAVGDKVVAVASGSYGGVGYSCTTAGTTASSQPAYNNTVPSVTVDGTASFTAENLTFTAEGAVTVVTDNVNFTASGITAVTAAYVAGGVIWLSGDNVGSVGEVSASGAAGEITLYIVTPKPVQVGDTFAVYKGCDKSLAACRDIFNNVVNRRAFDNIPGQDAVDQQVLPPVL